MSTTTLILDVPYLCYRAHYSTGGLSHLGADTGVLFGVLNTLCSLTQRYRPYRTAFCFDLGKGLREQSYVFYKANRHKAAVDESNADRDSRASLRSQMRILRTELLAELGFANILAERGYEADDLIASLVRSLPEDQEAVIISADKDLYQLLSPRVKMYKVQTKQDYTQDDLRKEFNITPDQWPLIKAIAGCSTDNVPGVEGVKEKTAAKYLLGTLNQKTKAFQAIAREEWRSNLPIVTLPYAGTPVFELKEDRIVQRKWRDAMIRLGMKTLVDRCPA